MEDRTIDLDAIRRERDSKRTEADIPYVILGKRKLPLPAECPMDFLSDGQNPERQLEALESLFGKNYQFVREQRLSVDDYEYLTTEVLKKYGLGPDALGEAQTSGGLSPTTTTN